MPLLNMKRNLEEFGMPLPSTKRRKLSPISREEDHKSKSSGVAVGRCSVGQLSLSQDKATAAARREHLDEETAPARNIPALHRVDDDEFEFMEDDEQAWAVTQGKDEQTTPVRNISTSRWVVDDDYLEDEEPAVRKLKRELREDADLQDTQAEDGNSRAKTPEPQETIESGQPRGRSVNMMQGCRDVDEFEKLDKIGGGTYGVVYKARDKKTGEIVALKKVKMEKEQEREGFPVTALREINILASLNHPSIVTFKEVVVGSSLDCIFVVMEYMDHDLKSLSEAVKQPFSLGEVKCMMLQLLQGIDYLHENGVIHRDLKTSNLLMNNCGELKICDFGMSRMYESHLNPYTTMVVTLYYRAPELLLGAKEYSTSIDMWSIGCILTELLSRKPLFTGTSEFDQLVKIFGILGTPNEKIWPGFTKLPGAKFNFKQTKNKLREMFPATPFSGLPYLSKAGLDLLTKLLTYDPAKRITAKDAINHPWFCESPLPIPKEFLPTVPVQNVHEKYLEAHVRSSARAIKEF